MRAFLTVIMLVVSNVFMTFAWYGHLKLDEMKITTDWPLILIILASWGVAFLNIASWFRPIVLALLSMAVLST